MFNLASIVMADLEKKSHTPAEYSTICPYLMVDDIKEEISFLQRCLKPPLKKKNMMTKVI